MGDEFVSVEPILLAILKGNSTAARILEDSGANEKDLTAAIQALRQGQNVKSQSDGMENLAGVQGTMVKSLSKSFIL